MRRRTIGVWWDIGEGATLRNMGGYIEQLRVLNIRDVSIEVQSVRDTSFEVGWNPRSIEDFSYACSRAGIRTGLMLWPRPTTEWIAGLRAAGPILTATGVDYLEFDIEENFRSNDLDGSIGTLDEAGRRLVGTGRDFFGGELQATTYPGAVAPPKTVIRLVDAFAVQAYSQSKDRQGYEWGGRYGPGNMQRYALDKSESVGARKVIMGLAAYNQNRFPNHTAQEAMAEAYNTAMELVNDVRYWSAKHILGYPGRTPNGYSYDFLKSLK